MISVVVPFYNVERYLEVCLQSLLSQSFEEFELILVDDGSTDTSHAIAERFSTLDRRVVLLRQENSGPGAARNYGIARARGKYLTFVDSDDRLPRTAFQELYDSAESNSADVVVAGLRRFNSSRVWVPQWTKQVHSVDQVGITLDSFPALLRNNYPVSKLYRRDFWVKQGLAFRIGVIYEDQPLIAQMLARAARLNVLTFMAYEYRAREDRSSISQRPEELNDLRDRVAAWILSRDVLTREASTAIVFGWYLTIYETHVHWYLNNNAVESREYWDTLRASLIDLKSTEPAGIWARVSAEKKVAIQHLLLNAQAELIEYRKEGGYSVDAFPSTLTGANVCLELPVHDSLKAKIPKDAFETPITARGLSQGILTAEFVHVSDTFELVLSGYAIFPVVDVPFGGYQVELLGKSRSTGRTLRVMAEPESREVFDEECASSDEVPTPSYFARVPAVAFGDVFAAGDRWDFMVCVTHAGQSVIEPLGNIAGAAAQSHGSGIIGDNGIRLRLVGGANRYASVSVVADRPDYSVDSVRVHGRTLSGVVSGNATDRPSHIYLIDEASMRQSVGTELHVEGNRSEFTVAIPHGTVAEQGAKVTSVTWTVRVETASGRNVPLAWTPTAAQFDESNETAGNARAARSLAGNVKLVEVPRG